ncbi:hypothetical protein SOVF_132220 [Spinacia oleracea]|nr:hypothetical protein SOVF_132220 [Spinacia oleracea]
MEEINDAEWEDVAWNINDAWIPEYDEDGHQIDEEGTFFDLNEAAEETGDMEHIVFPFDLNETPEQHQHNFQQQHVGDRGHQRKKKPRLSCDTRLQILMWLLNNHRKRDKDKPYYGAFKHVAQMYNVHPRTVRRIWKQARAQKEAFQRYNMATKAINAGNKC